MSGWTQHQCLICKGDCKIEIGRNEDNRSESVEKCFLCNGKGWIYIHRVFYGKPHSRLNW